MNLGARLKREMVGAKEPSKPSAESASSQPSATARPIATPQNAAGNGFVPTSPPRKREDRQAKREMNNGEEPTTPKRRRPNLLNDDLSPPRAEVTEEMAERIGNLLSERQRKKMERLKDHHAKRLLRESGLDFNLHFQKSHSGKMIDRDHWKNFKMAIIGQGEVPCRICQDLIMRHCIETARFDMETEKGSHPPAQPPLSDQAAQAAQSAQPAPPAQSAQPDPPAQDGAAGNQPGDQLALVCWDPTAQNRRKVGRPRKAEAGNDDRFNLRFFLAAERPEMYSFLTSEEARDTLPFAVKDSKLHLDKEMAKNPVRCHVCRIVMHFQCLTNDRQLRYGCRGKSQFD